MTEKTIHEGRNVKRIREMLGIKQDALAIDLGLSQQAISALEQKEALDKDMLEKIAAVLKVPVEAIKNFDEEKAIYNIQNNADTSSNNSIINYQFNPVEKIIELYERMLKEKDEMMARLEKLLEK
ncbi:MAG TPA: helix-turn-helix transcriptional regulator [Hanamia sp.]|nr:helix-turn-helix transcriptional regulator [Hanamia sp.]